MAITTLQEYIEAYGDALARNPPRNSPAYSDDPKSLWKYDMRNFGAGLADFPEDETKKIYGSLYGNWFVKIETFGANKVKVDSKEFFNWIYSAEQEERQKRKSMNESQMRLSYFIMTHYPQEYENALDTGANVCETALQIITRLTKRVPDAGDSAASQALSPQSGESTPEVDPAATQRR
ncbi:MAG: hypothetical protein ACOY4M_08215 [Pseudomonadota bacterium]|jgi:hypothetical protein